MYFQSDMLMCVCDEPFKCKEYLLIDLITVKRTSHQEDVQTIGNVDWAECGVLTQHLDISVHLIAMQPYKLQTI